MHLSTYRTCVGTHLPIHRTYLPTYPSTVPDRASLITALDMALPYRLGATHGHHKTHQAGSEGVRVTHSSWVTQETSQPRSTWPGHGPSLDSEIGGSSLSSTTRKIIRGSVVLAHHWSRCMTTYKLRPQLVLFVYI